MKANKSAAKDTDEEPPRSTVPSTPRAAAAERRKYERANMEVGVGVYSESNFYTGFTADISAGGLFVATYDLRPIGSVVNLEFTLPDGHEVKVAGEVRWVKDPIDGSSDGSPGMGVKFDELSADDLRAIEEFVSNREPLFHEG